MPSTQHHSGTSCLHERGRINGRIVLKAIETSGIQTVRDTANLGVTQWWSFCPVCDVDQLSTLGISQQPYLDSRGVMRTLGDKEDAAAYRMGTLLFTKAALEAGIHSIDAVDPTTRSVEALGRALAQTDAPSEDQVLAFSERVCTWGRGQRVWANLQRHHGKRLGALLHAWLTGVNARDRIDAIERGCEIKGLSVSFASKHLRMLMPEHFAVLDDVLCRGLGFAMNPAGYEFFMSSLQELQGKLANTSTLADVEASIFLMARQIVRSA